MGLGIALGAATRSFQDTTRQLEEAKWLEEQRQQQREQWQRQEAERAIYAQTAAPGQEVMQVEVNGGKYEMTPEQAAIYRQAGENGSAVGAITPLRKQDDVSYMNSLADRLGGVNPQAAIQMRMQGRALQKDDIQIAALRQAQEDAARERAVLFMAQNKDTMSDEEWMSGWARIMTLGKNDGVKVEVRPTEDGGAQMWALTPDGKQRQVPMPADRDKQMAAALKYLNMGTYQAARKEEREDTRNAIVDRREDRKLDITQMSADSEAEYRRGKLRIDEMEAGQRGAYYRALIDKTREGIGKDGRKWNLAGYDEKNNMLIYQGVGPDGRVVIDAQVPRDANGNALSPTAVKGLFKGGVSSPPKEDDSELKFIDKYLENNPDGTGLQAALDVRRQARGMPTRKEVEAGLTPGGSFFGAPAQPAQPGAAPAAIDRSTMLRPGTPEAAAELARLERIRAERATSRAATMDPVEAARLRRLERAGQMSTEADLVNSLYR